MSSDAGGQAGPPISYPECIRFFGDAGLTKRGGTPRIGVEFEWLPIDPQTGEAHPYGGENGVKQVLVGLMQAGFCDPDNATNPIHLVRRKAAVNLEPGGQLELSGSPASDLHAVAAELKGFQDQVGGLAREHGFRFGAHGNQPLSTAAQIQQVPKRRYAVMVNHFTKHGGARALDMMRRTAATQVSFDYVDEADAGRKLRLALLAAPVIGALFANSPLRHGAASPFASERLSIWHATDAARCGAPTTGLTGPWSFQSHVDELLEVPMMLTRADDGGVCRGTGEPFSIALAKGLPNRRLQLADWELHLSGIFTDARLRRGMVECRAPDAAPPHATMCAPALYTGLIYDEHALAAATELLSPYALRYEELSVLAATCGLRGQIKAGTTLGELANKLVAFARSGLERRGLGEAVYLDPLEDVLATGRGFWEDALARWDPDDPSAFVETMAI